MTSAAVTADVFEALDIVAHSATQFSLDGVLVDFFAQFHELWIRQFMRALVLHTLIITLCTFSNERSRLTVSSRILRAVVGPMP